MQTQDLGHIESLFLIRKFNFLLEKSEFEARVPRRRSSVFICDLDLDVEIVDELKSELVFDTEAVSVSACPIPLSDSTC